MTELSKLADIAEIVGVMIVIGGMFFAVLQMRLIKQQRREMAAIELFRFFGNPKFAHAYKTILHLPDGMTAQEIKNSNAGLEDAAMLISTTMENIGVMTYQRIVPFKIVNNLIGASTILLWTKLENWIVSLREELDHPSSFEWFQWLSERLEEHQHPHSSPAYETEINWRPANPQDPL